MSEIQKGKEPYSVKEVSKIIRTNRAYVYKLIKSGLLPATKMGSYKIDEDDFEKFLKFCKGKDVTDPYNVRMLD